MKLYKQFLITVFVFSGLLACKDNKNQAETSVEAEVATSPEAGLTYRVDPGQSVITWKGSKPLGTHNGRVMLESGSFSVVGEEIKAGTFKIDMTSIEDLDLEGENKQDLEAHLKGTVEGKEGDFFNVNKYPHSTFELTSIRDENGKTLMAGNLTIKDKTNNIEFPITINMEAESIRLKSEPFSIDRTKWDVNYGSKTVFDNLGDKFIDDEMELMVILVANKM